jgi:hypothetical protein
MVLDGGISLIELKLWRECAWVYGGYDMALGSSWGIANREVQRTWKAMGCDAVMKVKVPPPWNDPFWNDRMHIIETITPHHVVNNYMYI